MATNQQTRTAKRQQIVEAAYDLFKQNGFYATGVDLIMQKAGVSKRTMYKYFPTKNNLIVAAVNHYKQVYKKHLDTLITEKGKDNREKIRLIFDDAMHWFHDSNFHGCLAVNAMGEFSGKDPAIEKICVEFKQWEINILRQLTKDFDDKRPDELAHKLFVLLEGMSAIAQVNKSPFTINMADMADEVIEAHLAG